MAWRPALVLLLCGRSLQARGWRHFQPSLRSQVQVLNSASAQRLLSGVCLDSVRHVAKIGLECSVNPTLGVFRDAGSQFHP